MLAGVRLLFDDTDHAHNGFGPSRSPRLGLASLALATLALATFALALALAAGKDRLRRSTCRTGDILGHRARHVMQRWLDREHDSIPDTDCGGHVVHEDLGIKSIMLIDRRARDVVVPIGGRLVPDDAGEVPGQALRHRARLPAALRRALARLRLSRLLGHAIHVDSDRSLPRAWDYAESDLVVHRHPNGAAIVDDACILAILG
mmetsp:Transcript_57188/g.148879  ORF Transcript_57188/g.148879 Transcript_57188/m.148879 type:complete len:204 (+) Transcript_57188:618-1229(+)